MTSKLEKKFFHAFGIKPQYFEHRGGDGYIYPQITNSVLLELICVLNTVTVPDLGDINIGRLKMAILEECINALTKIDWENRIPTKEEFINEIRFFVCKGNKQLRHILQEYEELRQYHNKCCEENAKKLKEWLEKYNQVSQDFYSGKYCNKENCSLLQAKEQECEELNKELHKNFEEKDTLHLIIDRLLEASGYDTNTASAEDFEDVYEHMRYEQQQLDQLKAENEELKSLLKVRIEDLCDSCGASSMKLMPCKVYEKTLTEIKEITEDKSYIGFWDEQISEILQKISEVLDVEHN